MNRRLITCFALTTAFMLVGVPAFACGGLIGPRGSVNLLRTTTLAAYHKGVEHYITSFTYAGVGGGKFGSLVPLPGVPSSVERGGDWTLQRLVREVNPPPQLAARAFSTDALSAGAQVLLETRIDALDITILKGGAQEVGKWATDNGFELSADAPEVLAFYAERSPIFMAARFNTKAAKARGQQSGDGTPIHLTIPTTNPWVPLRILALGKVPTETVSADVFLLTDDRPSLLPGAAPGFSLARSERASESLMADLRADKGNEWVPGSRMWLSYVKLDAAAGSVTYDLAIDASGAGQPSPRAAGFFDGAKIARTPTDMAPIVALSGFIALVGIAFMSMRRRLPTLG